MFGRVFRITIFVLSSLVLLLLAAGVFLWFQRDALVRRYTPAIEAELGKHLRSNVRVAGLVIDFFPSLGAIATGVVITPHGACGQITASSAELRVDLSALVAGRYVINSLSFSGVNADLSWSEGDVSVGAQSDGTCALEGERSAQTAPPPSSSSEQQGGESFSLELKDFALRDADIVVRTPRPHHVQISQLVGVASLSEGVLSLGQPLVQTEIDGVSVDLSAQSIEVDVAQEVFDVREGEFSVGGEKVTFSGHYGPGPQLTAGKLAAKSLDLRNLAALTRPMGIDLSILRSGRVSVSSDVSFSSNAGFALRTADLQASQLSVEGRGSSYQASSVRGPVQCAVSAQKTDCSADLKVADLRFERGDIALSNVSGRLEKLEVVAQSRGGTRVSGLLTSSSAHFKSPTVEVRRIVSLSTPLQLFISDKGEYTVEGEVTGHGIDVQVADREILQVGGAVHMSLSSAGDSFSTSSLSASIMGHAVTVAGVFASSREAYSFRDLKANIGGGEVSLVGEIRRTPELPFSARLTVNNATVSTVATVILARQENPFDGQIRNMSLSLNGSLHRLPSSLTGAGNFKLMSTRIKGFDLTRALADAISTIPIANLALSKEKLTDDGLDKAGEATFTIADEKMLFSSLTFYRQQYTLQATGSYSFSKMVDLTGQVIFMKETLNSLGGGFDKLGALLGRVGKVEIPIFIRGQVPNISVVPDVVTLLKDNSGLTLAGNVLGATVDAGRSVADFVLSPFGSRKNKAASSGEESAVQR